MDRTGNKMLEFIKSNPWMFDGLNMTEAVKLLKEHGFKVNSKQLLGCFKKTEYDTYQLYVEETATLVQLMTPDQDQDLEKFRPKRYWFGVIGNV